MANISLIPRDVLINILLRLSVKHVLVSRSVCKSWNFILTSSKFISLYYNQQLCRQERNAKHGVSSFMVLQLVDDSYDDSIYHPAHFLLSFLTVKKMSNQLITAVEKEQIIDIPSSSPFENDCRYISLIGVYEGIICLANEKCAILYSPSIRKSQKIPFHNFAYPGASYWSSYVFGIWFEPNKSGTMKHYKVFRAVTLWNHLLGSNFMKNRLFTTVFEIYDSTESSWRKSKVTGVPPIGLSDRGLLFNGTFHLYIIGGDSIFTLDPISETSGQLLSLPSELVSHTKCPMFVLGEYLAWFSKTNDTANIWIMIEYGVNELWIKQYTFEGDHVLHSHGELAWHPLVYWNCMDENELFLELFPNELVSFNLVTKTVTEFPLCKTHHLMSVVPYLETLSSF